MSALGAIGRINAIVLRHVYLMRNSWPRVLELAYWPTVQMILWGFITQFLATTSSWVGQVIGILLGAVLLWDVLFRSQLGVAVTFFEEMYSRNLGHIFVSPLRPYELMGALLTVSLLRTLIGVGVAALLAIPFYHYSIFTLGLPLIAFFMNLLIMGWGIGLLVAAIVMRYGLGAESLAWVLIFAVAPISAVYYPLEVLPDWLQIIAHALPSSYVFEGMRAVLIEQEFRVDLFITSALLNIVYLAIGMGTFLAAFHSARKRGLLLQAGE